MLHRIWMWLVSLFVTPKVEATLPDANCFTLPNGDCVSEMDCMHGPGVVPVAQAVKHQRRSTKNLRHSIGGWSGAVAKR